MLVSNGFSINRRNVTFKKQRPTSFKESELSSLERCHLNNMATSNLEQSSISSIGPGRTTGLTDFNSMMDPIHSTLSSFNVLP